MADAEKLSEGQALLELQEKLDTCHMQMEMARRKQQGLMITLRRTALTLDELSKFEDGVQMYKPVGKAYFLAPRTQLADKLRGEMTGLNEEVKTLQASSERLQQEVTGVEGDIRDLLRSHPEAAAAYKQLVTTMK